MNRIQITAQGVTGRDPELKFSQRGQAWYRLPIAVTERVKTDDGWEDGDTTWLSVICFGSVAEMVAEYVTKGKRVVVTGSLKTAEWETDEGENRTSLEVRADAVGLAPFPPRGDGGGQKKEPRKVKRNDMQQPPF